MARYINKTSLSKSVLEMKFMKKSRQDFKNEEDAYRFAMYQDTCDKRGGASDKFVTEPSFVPCEDLAIGRLSFKGMNPEIERLMELEKDPFTVNSEAIVDKEADISDEQMALLYYNSTSNSLKRKHSDRKRTTGQRLKRNKSNSGKKSG